MKLPIRAWENLPIRAKGLVVVAIPLCALVGAVGLLYAVDRRHDREQEALHHIQEVDRQIRAVQGLLLDAETGVRGYVLTGFGSYLDPYRDAFAELPRAHAALEGLVGEDSTQLGRALAVRTLSGHQLETLGSLIAERREGTRSGEVTGLLAQDEGQMMTLREQLASMRTHEEERLQEQIALVAESRRTQQLVFVAVLLIGLIGGLAAAVLYTTGILNRIRMLEHNAHLLAEGAQLMERPSGSDELGRLAAALGEASLLLADREGKLKVARDEAERASGAKSDFLSRASHELRTALTAIIGHAGILKRDDLPAPVRADSVERIDRAGQHLRRLLHDFLDIGRIEAGVLEIAVGEVDVRAVIEECVEIMHPAAKQSGISIEPRIACDDARAIADPDRLRQVLINLVSNAIKYNRPQGRVEITCRRARDRVVIQVADEGPGIPPDKMDRVFVPFDRLDRDKNDSGVGLGLTVSKSLVELMGGNLSFMSGDKGGSTFSVALACEGDGAPHGDGTSTVAPARSQPDSLNSPTRVR